MDLKSFYKKIDVDSIKNKLPPLPQLKIPKIKSRKIFKSSREDLSQQQQQHQQQQSPSASMAGFAAPKTPQSLPGSSAFIDRTPTRISTVSSLMNINYGFKDKRPSELSTYRTANNFEEENCPDEFETRETPSGSSVTRFGDRCKKTYKDFSEFKIKSIFAKKTVVRKTEIEVDIYARQYERELHMEERELEIELEEDGYDFQFKEARRCLSKSSNSISPPDSLASGVPSPIRSEIKHLQQNDTPPLLAKRRNALADAETSRLKFKRSVFDESTDEPPKRPNKSTLWAKNERSFSVDSSDDHHTDYQAGITRMARTKKPTHDGISESANGENRPPPGISRLGRLKKSMKEGISEGIRGKHTATESEDDQPSAGTSRMAKIKKSMKAGITESFTGKQISEEPEEDEASGGVSRMARMKKPMHEGIAEGVRGRILPPPESREDTDQRPGNISRMARMKKSMKDGISEGRRAKSIPAESGDDTDQPTANMSRMAKLKKSMKEGIPEGMKGKNKPSVESGDDADQPTTTNVSRMARLKKSMKEGISEGMRGKSVSAAESGDDTDQPPSNISRMTRFKKSMKEGIPEGIRGKNQLPAESGDDADQPPTNVSRMARLKMSVKEGISEGMRGKSQPPAESGDDMEQPSTSVSKMARFKKSMKEGISEGFQGKKNRAESTARQASIESGEDIEQPPAGGVSKLARFKKSMKEGISHDLGGESNWNLKGIRNRFTSEESGLDQKPKKNLQSQESLDEPSDPEKKSWKLSNIHLRRSEPKDKNTEQTISSPEGKFSSIKMSINRLKNRKPEKQTSEESETEPNEEHNKPNVSDQLKAGLRRLKLRERTLTFEEEEDPTKTPKEPTINRFRNLKKSMKLKRPSEAASEDETATGTQPPPPLPPGRSTLIKKLNHIRSRKVVSEDDDATCEASTPTDQQKPKTTNLEKLEQARSKALRKVNAQVQKMKNIQGKSKDSPVKTKPAIDTQKTYKTDTEDLSEDDSPPQVSKPPAAVWTTNKMISQSLESDDYDDDVELPRVLIHQDNSDQYESTLIIAVTRPAPAIPSPIIKEIIPKINYHPPAPASEWIPNKNAVSNFLEMTPSPPSSTLHLDVSRGHVRKRSMDSNDSDSWIPENFRNKSTSSSTSAGLNKITECSEPWKVHSVFNEERLYKTRSIDIFSNRDGAGAFTDFEDQMKNVPVRRIAASAESLSKSFEESSDDEDDYDNASKITSLKYESAMVSTRSSLGNINNYRSVESNKAYRGSPVPTVKARIGNSQESLDANYDENDEISSEEEEDDDDPPTMAPSPPPSFSPPPPPLPSRKPPRMIPERNDSMVRLAHPLVKQGSMRRHFIEEIEPSDLGKVNKLITRYEKNPSTENLTRIHLIPSEDDVVNFEVEEKKPAKTNENGAKKRITASDESLEKEDKKAMKSKENNGSKKHPTRNISSDEEGNFNIEKEKRPTRSSGKRRPAPIPIPQINTLNINNNNNNETKAKIKSQPTPSPEFRFRENLDNVSIQSPNSEYGSPIGSMCLSERTISEYGSPIGVAFPTQQLRTNRRLSNRSSLRDDDTFYSFESDEENNFYSLGDPSDNRYTIEI